MSTPGQPQGFAEVDRHAISIRENSIALLAERLTAPWAGEKDRVRAIFTWIAHNIRYRMPGEVAPAWWFEEDTLETWKEGDEMRARQVLRRGATVCDGYARLFKTLAAYAGLEVRLIHGYARTASRGAGRFATNHTWNSVKVNGQWQLVDVTWGSGFIDGLRQFHFRRDDFYFLTPPDQLAKTHYPEDPAWALLPGAPLFPEFEHQPFLARAFFKYRLGGLPSTGILRGRVGDTLEVQLSLGHQPEVAGGYMQDSIPLPGILGQEVTGQVVPGGVRYLYIISETSPSWLLLRYNGDVIMHVELRKIAGAASPAEGISR